MRDCLILVALAATAFVAAQARAQEDQLLGRTLDEWSETLANSQGAERTSAAWAIAQLACRSNASPGDHVGFAELIKLVNDGEPLARYWGVMGLMAFAERLDAKDGGRMAVANAIEPLLTDTSAAPRIAAAAALVKLQKSTLAMDALIAGTTARDEATQIQAVSALESLGPLARPALTALTRVAQSPNEYARRIAARAVAKLTADKK